MSEAVIVAIITGGLALLGSVVSNYYNNSKTLYRIGELEKKQDRYNNLQERVVMNEKDIKHIYYEIDEIKKS